VVRPAEFYSGGESHSSELGSVISFTLAYLTLRLVGLCSSIHTGEFFSAMSLKVSLDGVTLTVTTEPGSTILKTQGGGIFKDIDYESKKLRRWN
jgi:hypothetical protein